MIIDAVVEQSETSLSVVQCQRRNFSNQCSIPMSKNHTDREPKFRVKVDTDMEDKIKANVFDSDKNPMNDDVTNGLYARNSGHAIVELNSVYFLNRKFGCTWKLNQLIVYEPQNLKGFQFKI
jgi:hypothetical protein